MLFFFPEEEKLFFRMLRMRRVFLFFIFISILHQGVASKRTDSLVAIIKASDNNSNKVDMLNILAAEIVDEDHNLALSYAEQALILSKKINYRQGAFKANYFLGKINVNYILDFGKAIIYFTNALDFCDERDKEQKAKIFNQLAFINNRQGNFNKAIYYYTECLKIAESQKDLNQMSNAYAYLSELYGQTGNKNKKLLYLKKVIDIENQTEFINTSPVALISIANYYEVCGKLRLAEAYLTDAMNKFKVDKNYRWESYTSGLLSQLYLRNKNYAKALKFANYGLDLALKHRLSKEISDNHNFLATIYDSIKDYKNAFVHLSALKSIDDSIFNIEKTKEITNIQSRYETSVKNENLVKKTLEKELSESKLKKVQMILITTFVVVILLIILVVILSRNYKVKQAINLELVNRDELRKLKLDEIIKQLNIEISDHLKTKANLEVMNAELNNFMYSASHDLKGPLAAIKGLTNLAIAEVSEKERLQYITMISNSVSKLNTLIDDMVQTTKVTHGNIVLSKINFVEFLVGIIDDIKNIESSIGVKFILEMNKDLEFTTDKILLRTIIYNLVENATKYKNPSEMNPFVRINANMENNDLKITIIDNGLGINKQNQEKVFEMFSRVNQKIPGTGLGLYLVKKSVLKLGGTIYLESTEGKGSMFEVTLPNKKTL
jgi:signal transduction histidine kinase